LSVANRISPVARADDLGTQTDRSVAAGETERAAWTHRSWTTGQFDSRGALAAPAVPKPPDLT